MDHSSGEFDVPFKHAILLVLEMALFAATTKVQ
jgi:hypothetical protein